MKSKEEETKEYMQLVKIFNELSDTKKAIWMGNGNLLLASQQAEKDSKKAG